jgi:hypothetical protein
MLRFLCKRNSRLRVHKNSIQSLIWANWIHSTAGLHFPNLKSSSSCLIFEELAENLWLHATCCVLGRETVNKILKLKNYLLSAVRDYLFYTFVASLHRHVEDTTFSGDKGQA